MVLVVGLVHLQSKFEYFGAEVTVWTAGEKFDCYALLVQTLLIITLRNFNKEWATFMT